MEQLVSAEQLAAEVVVRFAVTQQLPVQAERVPAHRMHRRLTQRRHVAVAAGMQVAVVADRAAAAAVDHTAAAAVDTSNQ